MCGRFTITIKASEARDDLDGIEMPEGYAPRFNVAPTQPVAVVADAASRKAEWMRWGLIPFWAKDETIGSRLINARSETIIEKPAFKNAFQKRRCLVLADGFYEWQKGAGPKGRSQPYYFKRADGKPFAFAGLWEFWRSPEGAEVRSFTIITTEANGVVRPVHDRMPVMLDHETMWDWMGAGQPHDLLALLKPYPEAAMTTYPVSAMVNRPEIDAPELVARAAL
ncbi:MAG TPA: SOS response-associated peptidase [Anaerolineaceae bacterium]